MPIIYEPTGAAREYAELAINLATGCPHGCIYCYAPAQCRRKREDFWTVKPRKNILERLEKEAAKMAGCEKTVLLSFLTDPYCDADMVFLTRQALQILKKYNFKRVRLLTKSGLTANAALFEGTEWQMGFSISLSNELARRYEPSAPPPSQRVQALRVFHGWGIKTWVSVEPVIDPAVALQIIADNMGYVDFWAVGKINHMRQQERWVVWSKFVRDVRVLLDKTGKPYLIKKSLLEAAENNGGGR